MTRYIQDPVSQDVEHGYTMTEIAANARGRQ